MRLVTAIKVLQKEMEFMGMSSEKLYKFIEQNPTAVPQKTLEAFKVRQEYQQIIKQANKK